MVSEKQNRVNVDSYAIRIPSAKQDADEASYFIF